MKTRRCVKLIPVRRGRGAQSIEVHRTGTGELLWSERIVQPVGNDEQIVREIVGSAASTVGCAIRGFNVYDMTSRFMPVALRYCAAARRDPGGIGHVEASEALLDIASDNASVWAVHAVAHARWAERTGQARPDRLIAEAMAKADELARGKDAATVGLARLVVAEPGAMPAAPNARRSCAMPCFPRARCGTSHGSFWLQTSGRKDRWPKPTCWCDGSRGQIPLTHCCSSLIPIGARCGSSLRQPHRPRSKVPPMGEKSACQGVSIGLTAAFPGSAAFPGLAVHVRRNFVLKH